MSFVAIVLKGVKDFHVGGSSVFQNLTYVP